MTQDNPVIKIYLSDLEELFYYSAFINTDGTYLIRKDFAQVPISTLPKKWDEVEIKWNRHPDYLGLFRSETQQYSFVKDARAILLSLFYASGGGIQANCIMRIDKFLDVKRGYETAYKSEIDFSQENDVKYDNGTSYNTIKEGEFEVPTLDSRLYTYLQGLGDTVFNIPIWYIDPVSGQWITDAEFLIHDGIKLLYNASYISSATITSPLDYSAGLLGFNGGNHGTGVNIGHHTIPSMANYSKTQNNGTTTFIGNDLLSVYLVQGNQNPGANSTINEVSFDGINNSQPYSKNNNSMFNYLTSQDTLDLDFAVSGNFTAPLTVNPSITGGIPSLKFVLFKVDAVDNSDIGIYTYISGLEIPFPTVGFGVTPVLGLSFNNYNGGNYGDPTPITLKAGLCYIFGIIWDNPTHLFQADTFQFKLDSLRFSLLSRYNDGTAPPVQAPSFPPSALAFFRLKYLLNKLVTYLPTLTTDGYGFPTPIVSPYSGDSEYLDKANTTKDGDCVPYQVVLTSEYCMHDLEGQSYLSLSLNQLFQLCKKQLGCGLSITPDGNKIIIERLQTFFDAAIEIMNLDNYGGVAQLSIKPFNDLAGCNLKLGYSAADINSDFGVDIINTEAFFNTPLYKLSQAIDLEEDEILFEQNALEKLRAQQVNQPIGSAYNPANPSSSNQTCGFYILDTPTQWIGSQAAYDAGIINAKYPLIRMFTPSNLDVGSGTPSTLTVFQLTQRNGVNLPIAQSIDPTASSQPYIFGVHYPETAINVELTACRSLQRDSGALLHSVLDLMDDESLVFRNTYVMQYNNQVLALSGLESNLVVGSGGTNVTTEFKDIPIKTLPTKLFRPFIFNLKTVSPVNMYKIMSANPYGFISFTWKNIQFKGFIWSISQKLSASSVTEYELIAHPDTTNEQLINS
jgi:hypothetical protein